MTRIPHRSRGLAAGLALATASGLVAVAVPAAPAAAAPDTTRIARKLERTVTVAGVNRHLIALQRAADSTKGTRDVGTRASGTAGYSASVAYVQDKLTAAGFDVEVQTFQFPYEETLAETLVETAPTARTFAPIVMTFSPNTPVGGVTAEIAVAPAPPADATPGCEATDWATAPAGKIAVVSRGGCTFAQKSAVAAAAGAVGVVIYNNLPGPLNGTLGAPGATTAPTAGITQEEGALLVADATTGPVTVTLELRLLQETRDTYNVIAETPTGSADNVVMVGAHLDSVFEGPGINDNGSGSASLLEIALQLGTTPVKNKVRFAWWGAEESGLLGSEYFVGQLSAEEQLDIALYLNFDMVGSPNFARFVYDGDDSDGEGAPAGPYGSAQIEALFTGYYGTKSLPSEGTDFSGRSDYGPFIAVGIPSGGLFTGAEGIKTPEQAALYGGTAGVAYDACYHQACDNLGNVNRTALGQNAKAIGWAVGRYALDTSDINGVGLSSVARATSLRSARAKALTASKSRVAVAKQTAIARSVAQQGHTAA